MKHFDIQSFERIVSPFFGGGSFEFYLQGKYGLPILANDKFEPLYNFWLFCKTENADLCELVRVDKPKFAEYRAQIMNETGINQARMYFVINRCSFSGATLSGGFSVEASKKRFTESSIGRISKLDLSGVDFFNLDFEEFIGETEAETKTLMFLDPPYYLEKKSKLYGNNGDMHENFPHEKLYNSISKKTNWMMTYNNCEFIKNLYKDFKIIETEWNYGMNKTKKSSELVIIG